MGHFNSQAIGIIGDRPFDIYIYIIYICKFGPVFKEDRPGKRLTPAALALVYVGARCCVQLHPLRVSQALASADGRGD